VYFAPFGEKGVNNSSEEKQKKLDKDKDKEEDKF